MIDLNKCKPGDKLRRRDGKIVEYRVRTLLERWPHEAGILTYTDNGRYWSDFQESEYDIVEVIPQSRQQGRWINAWGRKVWQAGWERWYAVDLSGDIYAYFRRPELADNFSGWKVPVAERSEQVLEYIAEAPGVVDWRTSITPAADMPDWIEQETHEVNGYTVPAPVTEPLTKGQGYWLEMPTTTGWCVYAQWRDSEYDQMWLERGLIHLTKEAAVASAKARHGIDPEGGK